MPGGDFEAIKLSKQDEKKIQNIYANHPKMIVNQHFGLSSILMNLKGRNDHF